MIYKYTKCESVIAKIMADSNMQEKNIRITDIREWIFEAVEKIGAPVQYVQKESGEDCVPIFEIHEHQVPIPEDLELLTTVAYSNNGTNWVQALKDESSFKSKANTKHIHHYYPEQPAGVMLPTHRSQLLGINGSTALMDAIRDHKVDVPTYWIKPGWIVFNKDKGFVKLSYKAIATDERGYPLIPDLASYQEAIYWYVMMKLSFPKFLRGSLGGKARYNQNTYFYIQQQWNFYRNQAYAEAMMPNESEMLAIKNEWTKLIPEWDDDENFFNNTGKKQLNFNDYCYGY